VAKLRERISVSKQIRQKFDLERFDLKEFNNKEVKEKYQVEISNRFAALWNLNESLGINSAWESVRESSKTSAKENLAYHRLKPHKQWSNDECSKLIFQWKQTNYNGCKIQTKSIEIICKV
jgi:hypothetical protein